LKIGHRSLDFILVSNSSGLWSLLVVIAYSVHCSLYDVIKSVVWTSFAETL